MSGLVFFCWYLLPGWFCLRFSFLQVSFGSGLSFLCFSFGWSCSFLRFWISLTISSFAPSYTRSPASYLPEHAAAASCMTYTSSSTDAEIHHSPPEMILSTLYNLDHNRRTGPATGSRWGSRCELSNEKTQTNRNKHRLPHGAGSPQLSSHFPSNAPLPTTQFSIKRRTRTSVHPSSIMSNNRGGRRDSQSHRGGGNGGDRGGRSGWEDRRQHQDRRRHASEDGGERRPRRSSGGEFEGRASLDGGGGGYQRRGNFQGRGGRGGGIADVYR